MARVENLSIALTPDMAAELRAAVEAGDYGSVSEVVRDALRGLRLRRKFEALDTEELRPQVQEGVASGPAVDAAPVFARLTDGIDQSRQIPGRRTAATFLGRAIQDAQTVISEWKEFGATTLDIWILELPSTRPGHHPGSSGVANSAGSPLGW
ncbi:MAG: type II toxin-antitoxin system ParD family antitoxin [Acetobacteraceae bacterium]